MKLIYCPQCGDILKLGYEWVDCLCGMSWGKYVDRINAVVSCNCIPLGFRNDSFTMAVRKQPKKGMGRRFEAFVIPKTCDTVLVLKSKRECDCEQSDAKTNDGE